MSGYGVNQELGPVWKTLLPKVISKHCATRRELFPAVPFGAGDGHLIQVWSQKRQFSDWRPVMVAGGLQCSEGAGSAYLARAAGSPS